MATTYKGTKYKLTTTELKKLARLCYQENGRVAAPAEASLMCNLYELVGHKKYDSLYDYVRNGGWFYKAAYYMDNGSVKDEVIESVRDVFVNGNRTVPLYVDEHDCWSDIVSASNNGVKFTKTDRSQYKRGVTVIKNRMGSTYTFWSFPSNVSDPFGYTDNARAPKAGTITDTDTVTTPTTIPTAKMTVTLPVLSRGSAGVPVRMWQCILQIFPDGIFGADTEARTESWQKEHGLTADGIVGKKTWSKGFKSIL